MKKLISVMVSVLLMASLAEAYVDPGTGGMIFRSIWPIVGGFFLAVAAFFSRKLIAPLKKFFRKIFRSSHESKKDKK